MDLSERSSNSSRHPWEITRTQAVIKILKQFKEFNSPLRILDIGCGDGFILDQMKGIYSEMTADGIDINMSRNEIDQRSTNQIKFFNSIDDLHGFYDIILLMDVLEHVKSDSDFLKNISRHAAPDTLFIITTPAYQRLFSAHDVFLKHYRRYNHQILNTTLVKAGLVSVRHGSLFFSLVLPRLIECLWANFFQLKNSKPEGIGNWNTNKFFTAIICSFLNFDNMVLLKLNDLGLQMPGLSLWTVAKLKL